MRSTGSARPARHCSRWRPSSRPAARRRRRSDQTGCRPAARRRPGAGLRPVRRRAVNSPPWPYTDSLAGVLSAFGAVAALYDRGRRGRTYRVNTSLAQTALLEQMPFAVDGTDADPSRGRDTSSATYRIYPAADRPVFAAIAAGDLPEALCRLGAASADVLETQIAARPAEACVHALCFGRSAASLIETPASTMAPGSFWARRGLRLERPSEDFGTVVTQAPVARFARTPAVAGDTPRIFGQGQPAGWAK
ncbi:MAG TPA: CoA transferase [Trebonia sp.]